MLWALSDVGSFKVIEFRKECTFECKLIVVQILRINA